MLKEGLQFVWEYSRFPQPSWENQVELLDNSELERELRGRERLLRFDITLGRWEAIIATLGFMAGVIERVPALLVVSGALIVADVFLVHGPRGVTLGNQIKRLQQVASTRGMLLTS